MKIATFNVKNKTADLIFHGKNKLYKKYDLNAALIKESDPDVIGLQEVTKSELSYLKRIFENDYNFYGEFRKSFAFTNECCPIMIKKEYVDYIYYSRTYSLSDNIFNIGKKEKGAMFPRICTNIIVFDGIKDFYHINNVHVDNFPIAQRKTFEEYGTLEEIIYRNEDITPITPIILGDFNSEITGDLKYFCNRNFLDDATEVLGKTYKPLNKSIDHILVDSNEVYYFDQKEYSNEGSDHSLLMVNTRSKWR